VTARRFRVFASLALLTGAACADPENGAAVYEAPARPTPRAISAPDTSLLNAAARRGDSLPKLRSLVVAWRGNVALERYYNGASASSAANLKSASKSIISALVGVAIRRGDIRSIDQPISELLVAETRGLDSAKRSITVEDLLTMRAGLQSTSFENYGAWVTSHNWVQDALRRPMEAPRGDNGPMIYSTGSSHLLSAIVTRASRSSTHEYASRHLFRPLGIRLRHWTTDPQGIYFGGNEMRMTPREMLAFGELYRNGGAARIGDSTRQLISKAWIDSSWVRRTSSNWSGNGYGYGWWMTDFRGYETYFAWGYGGQYIFILPRLETTIVITSDPDARSREEGHRSALFDIIVNQVIPAVGG
jgi:CubicO group peptidase (beta-lactamase class C family)